MLALAGRRLTEYLFSQNPEGNGTRFDELRAKAALKAEEAKVQAGAKVDEAAATAERAADTA